MFTGPQLKAALAFLGWSRKRLHEATDIPERTIQRIAEAESVPNANAQTVALIQSALEQNGIEFLNRTETSGAGVRYTSRQNRLLDDDMHIPTSRASDIPPPTSSDDQ